MNQQTIVSEPKPTYVDRLIDIDDYAIPSQYQHQEDLDEDIEKAIAESIILENMRKMQEHQNKKDIFIRKLEESCLKKNIQPTEMREKKP